MERRMEVVLVGVYCEGNVVFFGGQKGKTKLKSMFRKVRAEITRNLHIKKKRSQQKRFSFHYDPFSYALNFDNGNFGFFC